MNTLMTRLCTLSKSARKTMGTMALSAMLLLIAIACVEGESRQTLYLEADGAVTWSVLERDVRSRAEVVIRRAGEDQAFLEAARTGTHPAAVALGRLGGTPTTRVVRDEVPFTVATEARFPRLDQLMIDFFDALGMLADGSTTCNGKRCVLDLVVDPAGARDDVSFDEIFALLGSEDSESMRLVRTEGRFVDAHGFKLRDNRRVAILDLDSNVLDESLPARLLLSWDTEVD